MPAGIYCLTPTYVSRSLIRDSNSGRKVCKRFGIQADPTYLAMTLVSDLLEAPELLLDRFGGALRFVAPRPARRLLSREGLLKSR